MNQPKNSDAIYLVYVEDEESDRNESQPQTTEPEHETPKELQSG
jgi:hypothetical protein